MCAWKPESRRRRRGFTLIELLVVIAIIALLISILLPALAEAKRQGKMLAAMSNLHQFGVATNSYTADFHDRIWAFTWRKGNDLPTRYKDLKLTGAGSDIAAARSQAVDILRRRADREDIQPIFNWIPHVLYTHLVLQDYLAQRLPEKMVVDPADKHRLEWQQDPKEKFDQGFWKPFQPDPVVVNKRWPYSSSWQTIPAGYDRGNPPYRVSQGGSDSVYAVSPDATLGGAKLADVSFATRKVMLYDSEQRHFSKTRIHYGDESQIARVLNLIFDGSARVILTADANKGWKPNSPADPEPTLATYNPDPWEAPVYSAPTMTGYYRWTRGGLKGIDFGGSEIDTGQLD